MAMNLRILAALIALAAIAVGAMQTIGPEALGLPAAAAGWLGVLSALAAGAQALLPPVQHPHRRAATRLPVGRRGPTTPVPPRPRPRQPHEPVHD